jgi:hypothetical protein
VPQPVVIHDAISQFQISDTKPQTPDLAGIKCQLSTNEANPEKGVRTLQHQVIIWLPTKREIDSGLDKLQTKPSRGKAEDRERRTDIVKQNASTGLGRAALRLLDDRALASPHFRWNDLADFEKP